MTEARVAEQRRWIALALLAVAQFVVVLDASIINVALPTIGRALDFSQGNLQWVVNAYVLTFGGFLLLGGRVADLLGRRRIFIAGLILFALASLAGGLAQSEGQLIAARAVQGLGAAILSPAALSIVTTTFRDGAERNKALGVWGAVAGAGGAAGVLLGGILTDTIGWEWVFWVNVPVAIGAALLTPSADRREPRGVGDQDLRLRRRGDRDRRSLGAGLRAGRRQQRRLGLAADDRPVGALRGPARRLRRWRSSAPTRRWSRSPSSRTAPAPGRTWSVSWWEPRCSRCSSSSPSTCSRCSATARSRPGSPTCRWRSRSSSPPGSPRSSSPGWGSSRCSLPASP